MARLRHQTTGAVVEVPDEKVDRLGSEWVDADEKPKRTAKKAASSAKSD